MSYISRQDAKEQRRKVGDQRFSVGIQWKKPYLMISNTQWGKLVNHYKSLVFYTPIYQRRL
ncbi:hypothetical protein H6F39_10515 [Anabaena sp. FACHB-1250]|uniref:hypothetical protein n=1 Tax=Nostocales TaxID=1161 RepID=UPI0010F6493A|nr:MULTISPECIES: hypothetical protein [Nostocales]MBD2141788.1 hypothetical protein [Anabaena sp. FACHB-1250]MBD2269458.1 hypothetical protein [Anabaena sp. FACHB-1391]